MIYFDVKLRQVSYDLIVLIYESKRMNFFYYCNQTSKRKKRGRLENDVEKYKYYKRIMTNIQSLLWINDREKKRSNFTLDNLKMDWPARFLIDFILNIGKG